MDRNTCQEALLIYHRERRRKLIESYGQLNAFAKKGQIVFAGSSLMERFPLGELKQDLDIPQIIYNRGVGGFTTEEYYQVLEPCIFALRPSKLFLNIGTNDMAQEGFSVEKLRQNYTRILKKIRENIPDCQVYLMAYYPVNDVEAFEETCEPVSFLSRNNGNIRASNQMVEELAKEFGFHFVDVNQDLCDGAGRLRKELTQEGLHLWPKAYEIILGRLKAYL